MKPEYKNKVAMNGSPLTSGSAIAGVFAAALANGGSLSNVSPGIDYFAALKKVGQLHPRPDDARRRSRPARRRSRSTGTTTTSPTGRSSRRRSGRSTSRPTASTAATTARRSTPTAPHPYAARLWQEFIYSDQGQILYLKGYAHPARFTDMFNRKVIPKALVNALPSGALYAKVKFASLGQQAAAKAVDQHAMAREGRGLARWRHTR